MSKIEKEAIEIVNQMRTGFNPKVKCSVKKILIMRNGKSNLNEINKTINKIF